MKKRKEEELEAPIPLEDEKEQLLKRLKEIEEEEKNSTALESLEKAVKENRQFLIKLNDKVKFLEESFSEYK